MTFDLNLTYDWLIFDGLQEITFTSRRITADSQGDQIDSQIQALRRAPTFKELAASNGAYTGQDVVWHVPAVQLTVGPPKPRDTVIDSDNVSWTVLEVQWDTLKSRWRLITRNPIIAYDLRDEVSIEQCTITYDAVGAPVRTWPPIGGQILYPNIPARVQPDDSVVVDQRGVRGDLETYFVFLAEQVPILDVRECRVNWNGVYLDITGSRQSERIDELPMLTAERRP